MPSFRDLHITKSPLANILVLLLFFTEHLSWIIRLPIKSDRAISLELNPAAFPVLCNVVAYAYIVNGLAGFYEFLYPRPQDHERMRLYNDHRGYGTSDV